MMNYKKHAIALLLCGSLTLSLPYYAFAQEKQIAEGQAPDINFEKLESFGLFDSAESGSLGRGLYTGTHRQALSGLITNLQSHSDIIGLQRLTNRLLLTTANAGEIENDTPITDGADLTTLRLESMLKRGMNIQAFELISKLDEDLFYHPRLSKAGILSMLFSAEKGSACLENNATKDRFESDDFWSTITAYCEIALSETPSESAKKTIADSRYPIIKNIVSSADYKFNYTPAEFENLSLLERSILVAEDRLSLGKFDKETLNNIPAPHIQALMKSGTLTPQQKILLNAQAVNKAVLPAYALAEHLMQVNQTIAQDKHTPTGMEELAPLIKKIKGSWHIEDTQTAIVKSIAYAREFNPAFIVPFIDAYAEKTSLDEFSLDQIELIIRAFILSDSHIPKTWFANILARHTTTEDEAFLKTKLIMATALLSPDKTLNLFKTSEYRTNFSEDRVFKLFSYKNIIENIDNTTDQYARVRYIYENGFDSSWNKSYTMPPYVVFDELHDAARKNVVADVVALCNLISAGTDGKTIYPGLVAEMLENLTAVGLNKQAKEIVAQAVLDIE